MTSVSQRQLLVLLQRFTVRVISPLEQDLIGNRLHGTDVSEFIHARYGSLVKFLQDGTCRDDFVVRCLLTLIRLC